jgi:hypothetical protein
MRRSQIGDKFICYLRAGDSDFFCPPLALGPALTARGAFAISPTNKLIKSQFMPGFCRSVLPDPLISHRNFNDISVRSFILTGAPTISLERNHSCHHHTTTAGIFSGEIRSRGGHLPLSPQAFNAACVSIARPGLCHLPPCCVSLGSQREEFTASTTFPECLSQLPEASCGKT